MPAKPYQGFKSLNDYWRNRIETEKPKHTKDGRPYILKGTSILVRSWRAMNGQWAWYDLRDAPKLFGYAPAKVPPPPKPIIFEGTLLCTSPRYAGRVTGVMIQPDVRSNGMGFVMAGAMIGAMVGASSND